MKRPVRQMGYRYIAVKLKAIIRDVRELRIIRAQRLGTWTTSH